MSKPTEDHVMNKLYALVFAGLLLLQGCAVPAASAADLQDVPPAAPEYLPTVYGQRAEDGSFSLEADIDGDGSVDIVRCEPATEPDGGEEYYTGMTLTVQSGKISLDAYLDILYPAALAAALLVPGDGCMEIIASGDYASEDYTSFVWRLTGDSLSLVDNTVAGKLVSAGDGTLTFLWYDHPFGTWEMQADYVLSGQNGTLERTGDLYVPRNGTEENIVFEPYDEGGEVSYRYPTLRAPLEVYTDEGVVTLPAGTWFLVTGCDMESYVSLLSDGGVECRIDVRYEEEPWRHPVIIDRQGTSHEVEEYFYELFYAG